MSGYGQGAAQRDGMRVMVELRAVNHRFLDLKVRGASLDPAVEEGIVRAVRARLARGSVSANVRVDRNGQGGEKGGEAAGLEVDVDAARGMYAALTKLRDVLGMDEPVSLALVCAQPGILVPRKEDVDAGVLAACAGEAVSQALDALVRMRETEGAALARELSHRLDRIAALADEIAQHAAGAPERARQRLDERLARLLRGDPDKAEKKIEGIDEARLAQEVALLADRLDITEELVRLRSHLDQAGALVAGAKEGVGRRLEFLAQEMGREVNTIASKSQSAEIAHAAVAAKAELEKIREQVQNVE